MGWVAPIFAGFAVLATVPILVHLFGRPRAERRKFAALAFLLSSERKTARQRRVREILLLVARAVAIAAVPLILAKPFLEVAGDALGLGTLASGRAESAVIVLDDSRSMGLVVAGKPRFEEARARARTIVDRLGHDSEVAILLTSSATAPQPELTADRTRLRRALAGARCTHRPGDVTAALRRAAALLAVAPQSERRVYLISDFAAHGFQAESAWGAGGPTLVPVDVGGEARGNRAVIDAHVDPAPQLGPRGVRIDAVIASFTDEEAKQLPVTLRVDGKAVAKGLVDVPARGRTMKRFFHVLEAPPEGSGDAAHDVSVEIQPDGLADDDRRFARVELRRELRALLVDGDPRTIRREDELHFLETALRPGDRDDSRIAVTVTTVEDLPRRRLDRVDVLFLANAKAPDRARAEGLRGFVENGGGLFLSVGDNVDPDAWNAALGPLLPQPLSTVRTVGATLRARDDGEARVGGAGEHVARFDRRHPLLAPFTAAAGEALREARIAKFALLKPTPGGEERSVLLRLDSGAPLLVEGRSGKGRVLLLTTTIDRDWADLALQPAFLPLMQQAARYLARAPLTEPEAPLLVGAVREIPLFEGDQRLEVMTPGGATRHFDPERMKGRKTLAFAGTDEPGLYRVAATGAGGTLKPRGAASFAVNVDPPESDLARIDGARLAALTQSHQGAGATASKKRVELWHALGALLLALLLVEGILGVRRI